MGRIKKHGMWVKRKKKKNVFWISKRKLRLPYLLKGGGGGAGGGRHKVTYILKFQKVIVSF